MQTILTWIFATAVVVVVASAVSVFVLCKRAPQTWGPSTREAFRRNLHGQQVSLVTLWSFWMMAIVCKFAVSGTFVVSSAMFVGCAAAAAALIRLLYLNIAKTEFELAHACQSVFADNRHETEHSLGPHVSVDQV
jgi:hypothetical protein